MRSVHPIPKGLSVNRRISRMDARVCSEESGPVARMPSPPALETAATKGGVEIHDMPGSTNGTLIPSNLVTRVCMVFHKGFLVNGTAPRQDSFGK